MLKNKLYRRITGLYDFIEELEDDDYYNKASNKALKSFSIAIKYLKDNFSKIEEIHYSTLYRTINAEIIPRIRLIQRAKTRDVPWSLISNLDELLKNAFGDECFLVYRPQWHFNYSVLTEDINSYLKKRLIIFFPENSEKIENGLFPAEYIHIFSFPYLEKNNVLLNSIIGHEIGHFFHKTWESDKYKNKIENEHNNALREYYDEQYKNDLISPNAYTEEGLRILNGLYREIIPDIYGYCLFGPSIIFSLFFDLKVFETKLRLPSKETNYYPMTKYRVRLLVQHMLENDTSLKEMLLDESSECSLILNNMIKEIYEYLQDDDDLILLSEKSRERKLFESTLAEIISYTKNEIEKKNPGGYLRYENITKLFDMLNTNIPINELDNQPIDIMEIIFTGWIYYAKIDKDSQGDDFIFSYKLLMRLLLKSLHSSYLHKKYLKRDKK